MAKKLDERVEYAIDNLWVHIATGDGALAKAKLEEAAAEGDADANYFLGRCYLGESFVNPKFGFEENEELGMEYFNRSIEGGSAIGMFAGMRLAGFTPRTGSYVNPPYNSLKEIWDEVNAMAEGGEVFCQYLIANAYYFGDVIKFMGRSKENVKVEDVRVWMNLAINMFEKCIAQGMGMGIGNLINIYTSGDYGLPVRQERASQLRKIGADMGMGTYEVQAGRDLAKNSPGEALALYDRGIEHGCYDGYFYKGLLYTFNGKLGKDLFKAKQLFEMGLEKDACTIGCKNRLGEIYFYGGDGIEPDYTKAAAFFQQTISSTDWCSDMLGTCYLRGLGVPVNYEEARKLFEKYPGESLSAIGLGEIYGYGLGVKQDIVKAMGYWDKFPNHPRVLENKKKFKKTLFGWKQIS